MTGTIAYLKYPEIAARIRAAVPRHGRRRSVHHQVGVASTRSPNPRHRDRRRGDVFGRYVIDGAMRAAGDGDMARVGRRPGRRMRSGRHHPAGGSVTDLWEGGFAIPTVYSDHPDIYIHTTRDLADNIRRPRSRLGVLAAATGYYLATMLTGRVAAATSPRTPRAACRRRARAAACGTPRRATPRTSSPGSPRTAAMRSRCQFVNATRMTSRDGKATWPLPEPTSNSCARRFRLRRRATVPVRNARWKARLTGRRWIEEGGTSGGGDREPRTARSPGSRTIDGTRTVADIRDAVSGVSADRLACCHHDLTREPQGAVDSAGRRARPKRSARVRAHASARPPGRWLFEAHRRPRRRRVIFVFVEQVAVGHLTRLPPPPIDPTRSPTPAIVAAWIVSARTIRLQRGRLHRLRPFFRKSFGSVTRPTRSRTRRRLSRAAPARPAPRRASAVPAPVHRPPAQGRAAVADSSGCKSRARSAI